MIDATEAVGRPAASAIVLRDVLDLRFRANPAFELVAPDRLPAALRPSEGPGEYLILVPRSGSGITAKVLNGTAAQLVESLGTAGHLPVETRAHGGPAANEAVARLVLDGALEIEDGDRFVSGPQAHRAVFARGPRAHTSGPLAELSLRAIRHGQELALADVGVLSRRLYGFGTIPRSPRWERLVGPADDTAAMLGLAPGGRAQRALDDYEGMINAGWLAWSRRVEGDLTRPTLPFKLYVSPRPESLAECLPVVAGILAERSVWSFKVGRGVLGLLRPDKVIAYLEDFGELERLAGALAAALGGCAAHGVPFTAEASPDGLLSWGMDPPSGERLLDALPQESWRLWVTNRLAGGLIHAQAAGDSTVEPWEFALDRLALEGVDPATWLPADTIWPRLDG